MKFGTYLPNCAEYADPSLLLELGCSAERAGWDGFFIWDHLMSDGTPAIDATTVLGALAARTERVAIGAMVIPLARRRPWKVAKEFATLMNLSQGRAVLGVGLGDPPEEFSAFGEPPDLRERAIRLDEGLEIVTSLLSGEHVVFSGKRFEVEAKFLPRPDPSTDREIWVATRWPSSAKGPLRRAARWGTVFPVSHGFSRANPLDVEDIQSLLSSLQEFHLDDNPPQIIHAGATSANNSDSDLEAVQRFAELGVSWWLEFFTPGEDGVEQARERINAGPPRQSRNDS